MIESAMFKLFERAKALGVSVPEYDLEELLEALHRYEGVLMDLRHDVQQQIAFDCMTERP
jgi:hypothetical protein